MRRPEADLQPVPGIDGPNLQGDLHLLRRGEVRLEEGIVLVRRAGLGNQGERLGPGQSRPLAVAVERRFTPGIQHVKPHFHRAMLSGIGGVHMDAEGTAIDLRDP